MIVDRDSNCISVYVRQSWLNEFRTCAERARWSLTHESPSTDLAMVGTAVHAAIEQWIDFPLMSIDDIGDAAAKAWAETVASEPNARWTRMTFEDGEQEARRLARSWHANLRHKVDAPIAVEQEFCVRFVETEWLGTPVVVYLTGTIDLVQKHSLTDWKTSNRKFSWRDSQSHNIQSAVYAVAAQRMGVLDYPITMDFAVLLRGTDNVDICTVRRDATHESWLRRMTLSAVRQMLTMGADNEWPMNDTHALCSPDWCSAWADCKGAHLPHIPYPTRRSK